MKKIFLSSYFKQVAWKLPEFLHENPAGKIVSFISTASLVEEKNFYVEEAREEFVKMGLRVDEVDISTLGIEMIIQKMYANDYIYMSGGNTFFLLQELKRTGIDKALIELIQEGKPYIGESAGAIILAPNIEYIKTMDDYAQTSLDGFQALNIVKFYPLPHFGDFPFDEITKDIIKEYGEKIEIKPFSNSEIICM